MASLNVTVDSESFRLVIHAASRCVRKYVSCFSWDWFDVIAGKELFKPLCSCMASLSFCVHDSFLLDSGFQIVEGVLKFNVVADETSASNTTTKNLRQISDFHIGSLRFV